MIKKRPGADWEIVFQHPDGLYGRALLFGMNDLSQLQRELLSAMPDDADVIQIKRLGFDETKAEFWEDLPDDDPRTQG